MPTLAIVYGLLIDALGVGGYIATGSTHKTALIPVAFGSVIFLCGFIAAMKPQLRMHVMHVAALTGVLGVLGGLGMGLPKLSKLMAGTADRPTAVILQIAMGILCLLFVVFCVSSFIAARRARKSE